MRRPADLTGRWTSWPRYCGLRSTAIAAGTPDDAGHPGFRNLARELHVRTYDPFPACSEICPDGSTPCRWAAADLIAEGRFADQWDPAAAAEDWVSAAWSVAMDAGSRDDRVVLGRGADPDRVAAARRASLCFAQQMLADRRQVAPPTSRADIAALVAQA